MEEVINHHLPRGTETITTRPPGALKAIMPDHQPHLGHNLSSEVHRIRAPHHHIEVQGQVKNKTTCHLEGQYHRLFRGPRPRTHQKIRL